MLECNTRFECASSSLISYLSIARSETRDTAKFYPHSKFKSLIDIKVPFSLVIFDFVLISDCHQWSAAPISSYFRLGLPATLVVNVALMASHWHQRAWTVSFRASINAEHETGEAASTVFQVFGMIRCRLNQLYQLASKVLKILSFEHKVRPAR